MAGTIVQERVAGIPDGWPSEIDSSVKVRYVAPLLVNMSDRSADFLKMIGGVSSFEFNNTTIEWVEDDVWNRRLTHGGLAAAGTTSLTITGAAHRYPIGTILYNVTVDEYVRISGHVDANTITLQRDIIAGTSEGAWASTDEVIVAGLSMDENDDYVFRPTSIFSLPYNRPQVFQTGVQASFRRMDTALHGNLTGRDLEKQSADLVSEMFVLMEEASIFSPRFDGTSAVPSMFGGIKFYVTSANGAQVTDLSGAPFTRRDMLDVLNDFYYTVGNEKMAKTVITSAWGAEKISSFFSAAERLNSGSNQTAGVTVNKLNTEYGVIDIMMSQAVAKNEMYFLKKENIKMGHYGKYGAPQLRMLPTSTVGPRIQKAYYGDVSMIVSGVQAMGRVHDFSLTA